MWTDEWWLYWIIVWTYGILYLKIIGPCCHEVERRGKAAEEEFIQVPAGCNPWRVPIFWDFRQEKVRNVPPQIIDNWSC
jgi:hypothetical protein